MTKNNWWKYLCLFVLSLVLSGCSLLDNLLFTQEEVPEFSFSGYVMADGKALEGATVDCGVSTTETNGSGYFKFSGINKVVQVSVKKDGYLFDDDLVFVNSLSADVNFNGYKLFDKSGVVKNNGVVLAGVEILATSENGEFRTVSNEYGEFYLTNLAGQVKVTALKDGFNFFKSSFTIDKEDDVVISGLTNIMGEINLDFENGASVEDFVLKANGQELQINNDFSFEAKDVEPGTIFTLSSDKYFVENDSQLVLSDIKDIIFDCKKYYDIEGTVMCGNSKLSGVTIKCGNKIINCNDGVFAFENLYGVQEISAIAKDYKINSIRVNAGVDSIKLVATTTIAGSVKLDIGQNFDDIKISYNGKNVAIDTLGKFSVDGVQFGEKLVFESDSYFVDNEITMLDRNNINIFAYKLYSLNVNVQAEGMPLAQAVVTIDGENYTTDNDGNVIIENLYGNKNLQICKDGYKFDDNYACDYINNNVNISGCQVYNVFGKVKSGDIEISKGYILLNGERFEILSDGTFVLNNLYGEQTIRIEANGFNSKDIQISKDNASKVVDLSYNIHGKVICGNKRVGDVQVFCGEKTTKTDENGEFTLRDIVGNANISYSKTWYSFPQSNVTCGQTLLINGTYSIEGKVSKKKDTIDNENDLEYLTNFKVILINKANGNTTTALTNSDGVYRFTGLVGEYALVYDMESALTLQPSAYDISTGGNFDFSNNGYSFGGVVTCGDKPLAGVTLTVGSAQVTTDENGKYTFLLVTKSGVITIEKEGYTFVADGHSGSANDSIANRNNINYIATYKVEGVISSGSTLLAGVNVKVDNKSTISDSNGYFQIAGLVGDNSISLALDNYKFEGIKNVSGYQILNYVATFDVNVSVFSEDLKIVGAKLIVNNVNQNLFTNNLGQILIENIQIGDNVTFVLEGYDIENKVFDECVENATFNSTYAISGQVSNCGTPLANVKVWLDGSENVIMTNENGEFSFDCVQGSKLLKFEKVGFDFDSIQLMGSTNLEVMSKFDVEGLVKVGDKGILGVLVKAGEQTALTDNNGKFKITGLNAITLFTFEKTGYDFGTGVEVNTPNPLVISGTYKLSGKIKSGDILLANATLSIDGVDDIESDSNGYFQIEGLCGRVNMRVLADGYNSKELSYDDYTANIIVNLDYDVVINFSGISDYSNILITANSTNYNCGSNTFTLKNLKGETTITLSKKDCNFAPTENNSFVVNKSATKNITITKLFNVSGTVKTATGATVAYATVVAGKNSTITDSNGRYSFVGLSGEPTIKVILPYNTNGEYSSDLEISGKSVKTDGVLDITIPNKTFAVNFLNYAYDNLRYAMSYQIFGNGKVVASPEIGGKQEQTISVIYKQDALGNKLFQNLNRGSRIKILSFVDVDPNVSLLSLFYTDENNERKVKYQQVLGEDKFDSNGNPIYSGSWNDTDVTTYKNIFGVDYNGFSPYVINKNTVKSVSGLTFDGDNYKFTLELNCAKDGGTYTYYEKLMKVMCSQQDLDFFDSISLTFTIGKNGLPKQMVIAESYQVTSSSVKAPTTANITYNFVINSLTEKILDIDISTPSSAQNSLLLGQEEPVEMGENARIINYNYNKEEIKKNTSCDIVAYKKEELL